MPDTPGLLSFLKDNELFKGLPKEKIASLIPFLHTRVYEKGALIIQEEEVGEELFVIKSGRVEIIKKEKEGEAHHPLAILHAGEWFGEMPLFDQSSRSASVRALEETEVVIVPLKELNALSQEDPFFSKMMVNLAKKMNARLRNVNEVAVQSLKEELKLTTTHDHMGQFIIHLFILLTFFFYMVKAFEEYAADTQLKKVVVSILVVSLTLGAVSLVRKSKYPLKFYGLSWKKWQKNACEGALFTIPVLLVMVLFKWVLIVSVSAFKDLSVFQFGPPLQSYLHFFHKNPHRQEYFLFIIMYILLVPVQEFLARGCLQSAFQNFFRSSNRVFLAILTSNLLFGLFHALRSFSLAACAFLLGIFWGWLYARQGTIVGSSVSHALVGAWAFGVLNYQSILIY